MRSLFCILLCLITFEAFTQNDGLLYLFKKDWSPAKNIDQATYFMHVEKENDTVYTCRYYNKAGPMIKWETYSDSGLEKPNGIFAWYNAKGRLDSSGMVNNGRKDKDWFYNYDDSLRAQVKEYYENGHFISRTNYLTKTITLPDGKTEPLDKPQPKDSVGDKTFTVTQVAAEFEGGLKGWMAYLSNNLKTPDRFISLSRPGTKATVGIDFYVNKEGFISGVFIHHSYEWSVDTEAMRVVKTSPRWKPAVQNGKNVIYRHRQSITFSVSN